MRISDWSSDVCSSDLDVMIGTHKLLQADVRFKRLGLVIVDEEQRFGVRQKEQLQKLRAEVDLLDRKSVVQGKSVSVRVDLGGSRIINNKHQEQSHKIHGQANSRIYITQ